MRRYYLLGTETPTPISPQSKSLTITENGSYEILPDDGHLLSKVRADVNLVIDDVDGWYNADTYDIDTGVIINNWNLKVEMELIPLTDVTDELWVGCKNKIVENMFRVGPYKVQDAQTILFIYAGAPGYSSYDENGNQFIIKTGEKLKFTMTSEKGTVNDKYSTQTLAKKNLSGTSIILLDTSYCRSCKIILFSLKIYNGENLVCYIVPKKIAGTNIHLLWDNVSQRIIAANVYDNITTLETPDYQTITVTNEEYQAIMPILEEMRGEELINNAPKPVVD